MKSKYVIFTGRIVFQYDMTTCDGYNVINIKIFSSSHKYSVVLFQRCYDFVCQLKHNFRSFWWLFSLNCFWRSLTRQWHVIHPICGTILASSVYVLNVVAAMPLRWMCVKRAPQRLYMLMKAFSYVTIISEAIKWYILYIWWYF